jgi:hypothetical protein
MKTNAKVVNYGSDSQRNKALVNVIVEFSGSGKSGDVHGDPNEDDEARSQVHSCPRPDITGTAGGRSSNKFHCSH